jgi:hypothetical protein
MREEHQFRFIPYQAITSGIAHVCLLGVGRLRADHFGQFQIGIVGPPCGRDFDGSADAVESAKRQRETRELRKKKVGKERMLVI